jgi:hypothetical protein
LYYYLKLHYYSAKFSFKQAFIDFLVASMFNCKKTY